MPQYKLSQGYAGYLGGANLDKEATMQLQKDKTVQLNTDKNLSWEHIWGGSLENNSVVKCVIAKQLMDYHYLIVNALQA